jgi:hypothetical protein
MRKAPMGTMPESECNRRKTKEYPSPARSGATPFLTRAALDSTELAEEATKPTPFMTLELPPCSASWQVGLERMNKHSIIKFAKSRSQETRNPEQLWRKLERDDLLRKCGSQDIGSMGREFVIFVTLSHDAVTEGTSGCEEAAW